MNEAVSIMIASNRPLECMITVDANQSEDGYAPFSFPEYSRPKVSIIIPAYNAFSFTYLCLRSIYNNTSLPYEVILADDCSTDETTIIEEVVGNIFHIINERNLQFLLNCNNAAKHARGEYLFFLNNDTQVQSGWLEPLVDLMERDSNIGLVGAKLVYPDGRLQEAGGIIWQDGSAGNYGRFENPENPEYNYVKDVDYISGAAILIRKTVWDMLDGFDENFAPAYYEDVDIAFSIRNLGFRTVYQPKSIVVHYEGITNGVDLTSGQKHYQVVNADKFYEKWKDVLDTDHFPKSENTFSARDRSRFKETILFIDQYVPQYDKDAGSRNTFSYMKLFIELGYHVLFLGNDFFPYQPYTEVLQQIGVEVLFGSWYQNHWRKWLKTNGRSINYVYLNRPGISEKYIDVVKKSTDARVIYHGHDLHFVRMRSQYMIEKERKILAEANNWARREKKLFSKSDVILTVSEKERETIRSITEGTKPIVVIPVLFFESFSTVASFNERKDILFVGGFKHTPNIDGVLWFTSDVMPMLPDDAQLLIVGSNPPEEIRALTSERVIIKGFVTDEELGKLYASSRVAIAPLRYGAGVKGKTIEALINHIPVVSTTFGIEGLCEIDDIISPCDDAESFSSEISRYLASDSACMEIVEKYEDWLNKWVSKKRAIEAVTEMMNPCINT